MTGGNFQELWDKTLHGGVFQTQSSDAGESGSVANINLSEVEENISRNYKSTSGIELSLYYKVGLGSGSLSAGNNPWLHELPDPVSKATWDNYLAIPKKWPMRWISAKVM